MEDDNIFDEDDALDYILYKENSKGAKRINNGSGCLSVLSYLTYNKKC